MYVSRNMSTKFQPEIKSRIIEECCEGHEILMVYDEETGEKTACIPYCKPCLSPRLCTAPNKCPCKPGHQGDDCFLGEYVCVCLYLGVRENVRPIRYSAHSRPSSRHEIFKSKLVEGVCTLCEIRVFAFTAKKKVIIYGHT